MKQISFFCSFASLVLLSQPMLADHVFVPKIANYDQVCVAEKIIETDKYALIPSGCYCEYDRGGKCLRFIDQEQGHRREVARLHDEDIGDQTRKKLFNECMFKNIKPSSNAAHYRTVRKYCKDQASE